MIYTNDLTSRKFTRRAFLAGLGATAALPILVACQPSVEKEIVEVEKEVTRIVEKPVEVVVEKEVTRLVEQPAAMEQKPAEQRGGTLRFNAWAEDHFRRGIDPILAKTGIKVSVQSYPQPFNTKLMAELAAGVGPDIILLDSYWMGDFFARDLTADFATYIKKFNLDIANFSIDPYLEGGYKGKLEGIGFSTPRPNAVYINGDMVDAEGMKRSELPLWGQENYNSWTINDMLDFGDKMKKVASDGKVERYGWDHVMANLGWKIADPHNQHVGSNGAWWFEDPWDYEPTESNVTDPKIIEALDWAYPAVENKISPDPGASTAAGGADGPFTGKLTAATQYPMVAGYPSAEKVKGIDVQTIYLPYISTLWQQIQSNLLCVNKESQYRDEVGEWIVEFITDDDVVRLRMYNDTPIWTPKKFIDELEPSKFKDIHLMTISNLAGHSTVPHMAEEAYNFPRHYGLKGSFFKDTIGAAWSSYMTGAQSLIDAFTEGKNILDAELAKGYG